MVLQIIRAIFVIVVVALAFLFVNSELIPASNDGPTGGDDEQIEQQRESQMEIVTWSILIPAALAVMVVLADSLWKRKNLKALSGLLFGLLAGLVIAYVLGLVVDLIAGMRDPWADSPLVSLTKTLIGAISVYLCVSFILQTKDDFRFIIPYVEFAKDTKGRRPILLDTSVIIDGRIADIVETRIFEETLVVPRFVLAELQAIADSSDKLKRNRGRRGLDMLNRLQTTDKVDIEILDTRVAEVEEARDVDTKLVALAEHLHGRVVTNDYNLGKVAKLREVEVININDLANALKPVVLPGEEMSVKIIKPGEEFGQGVGYLEDGTMIVAEGGRDHVGEQIAITVTSVLQTSAGRMIFGRAAGADPGRGRRR